MATGHTMKATVPEQQIDLGLASFPVFAQVGPRQKRQTSLRPASSSELPSSESLCFFAEATGCAIFTGCCACVQTADFSNSSGKEQIAAAFQKLPRKSQRCRRRPRLAWASQAGHRLESWQKYPAKCRTGPRVSSSPLPFSKHGVFSGRIDSCGADRQL